MPLVGIPFEKVTIDLIDPLSPPIDKHHMWVLTLVDIAARYPEATPLFTTVIEVIAEALLSIFTLVGFRRQFFGDNRTQFVSGVTKEVARLMSMHQVHSSPSLQ